MFLNGRRVPCTAPLVLPPGGMCYHVLNRGNGRTTVFHKDGDYQALVKLLGDACDRLPTRVLAYC